MKLDSHEREELEQLRLYKRQHEGKAITRAFAQLEQLMDSGHDPVMSRRAFRVIADCLLSIKEKIDC